MREYLENISSYDVIIVNSAYKVFLAIANLCSLTLNSVPVIAD